MTNEFKPSMREIRTPANAGSYLWSWQGHSAWTARYFSELA